MLNENETNKTIGINDELVTPEYLIAHGFIQYGDHEYDDLPINTPTLFKRYCSVDGYIEKELHRQMFIVQIDRDFDSLEAINIQVYVQEDIGCGFIEIPFPWVELSVDFFESVYYGIRGHKPKKV